VTFLGITGHQQIPSAAVDFVVDGLEREISLAAQNPPLWGITSLAIGADQTFAELILRADGELHVVVPSRLYESTFAHDADLQRYEAILRLASRVDRLEFPNPTPAAFYAAGRRVVDLSDTLVAVWDGKPAAGLGGTADIVRYANELQTPVVVVWPPGVAR
jgi:hypothetical protein